MQNARTIAPVGTKIGPKSFPGLSDGTQCAPEVSRERLGASPRRPKGAPGAPRERSRFVWGGLGEPTEARRDARRRPNATKVISKLCTRRANSLQSVHEAVARQNSSLHPPNLSGAFFETCHEYVQTLNSPKQRQTLKHIEGSLDNLGPKPSPWQGLMILVWGLGHDPKP